MDMDLKEEAWQVEVRVERGLIGFEGYLATVSVVYVITVVAIDL